MLVKAWLNRRQSTILRVVTQQLNALYSFIRVVKSLSTIADSFSENVFGLKVVISYC